MSLTKAGFHKGMAVADVEKMVRDAMEEARHADGVGPIGDLVILPKVTRPTPLQGGEGTGRSG